MMISSCVKHSLHSSRAQNGKCSLLMGFKFQTTHVLGLIFITLIIQ